MDTITKTKKLLSKGGQTLLNIIFPAQCAGCNDPVDTAGSLCAECWPKMTFISPPFCAQCGYPFDYEISSEMLCGNCLASPPAFSRSRSVLKYDDNSRDMVLAFKHADRTDKTPVFAKWMARTASDILKDKPIIAPVPLHPKRLIKRRYNQSALLAKSIGSLSQSRVIPDLLLRTRDTNNQGGKSIKGRHRNVQGAFSIHPRWEKEIVGKHILLIDDVYTTGATVSACSDSLLRFGARQVDVLTLCRVVRPAILSI
ncbi:MAG: ComF family protein [Sneathiella sp.]